MLPFLQDGCSQSVEGGEGHGPRKEFFDLAAAEMYREFEAMVDVGDAVVDVSQGSALVTLLPKRSEAWDHELGYLAIGTRLSIKHVSESASFTGVIVEVTRSKKHTWTLRLNSVAPFTASNLPFGYQKAAFPLFRTDPTWASTSSYCWFNPGMQPWAHELVPHETFSDDRPTLGKMFSLAGWLAAQAIANGVVLPLPLPVAFFRFLMTPVGEFHITEAEICEIDPQTVQTIQQVRGMAIEEFRDMLELEDLDPTTTKEDWIRQNITDIFMSEVIVKAMACFQEAFFKCGLRQSYIFRQLQPEDLQAIVVGRPDDSVSDFQLQAEFRIIPEAEFDQYPHNRMFLETLFDVMEHPHEAGAAQDASQLKRLLLKFITGRARLPARKGEEVIRLELPYTAMTSQAYDSIVHRLPQAHTCNNTLEIPNYCEALLFSTTSWWFRNKKWQVEPQNMNHVMVTDWDRESILNLLPEEERSRLQGDLRAWICGKLVMAIANANSYDLDEMPATSDFDIPSQPPSVPGLPSLPSISIHSEASARALARSSIVQLPSADWLLPGVRGSGSQTDSARRLSPNLPAVALDDLPPPGVLESANNDLEDEVPLLSSHPSRLRPLFSRGGFNAGL
uniref:HECT domain-containing protein n=1 Tax=Eutreptiella gymnastica TaxID=73025 RepID=A0A7S1N130_9EUGL|mmetsp:Transcript_105015/g.181102  ORF Transcript_105015/g.181102 Transcript_105015/m.181102 type:complete len:619 (+) Transcript_105015:32-1888(+)